MAVVAASDGIWDALTPAAVGYLVRNAGEPQTAAQAVVDAALAAGSRDNVTAVVVWLGIARHPVRHHVTVEATATRAGDIAVGTSSSPTLPAPTSSLWARAATPAGAR